MSNKNFYVIDGVTYTKRGWLGCQLESKERGLKKGDTRVILDQLFYVFMVDSFWYRPLLGFSKPEVSWGMYCPEVENSIDDKAAKIRAFYAKMEKS